MRSTVLFVLAALLSGQAAANEDGVKSVLLRAVTVTYELEESLAFWRDIMGQEVVEWEKLDAKRAQTWLNVSDEAEIDFVVLKGNGDHPATYIQGSRITFIGITDPKRPPHETVKRRGEHGDMILVHRVGNLDEIHRRLKDAGHEFLYEPRDSGTGRARTSMVIDPNGHIVELIEMKYVTKDD